MSPAERFSRESVPRWLFAIYVGQANRLALNPPTSEWGHSMLAKRGGYAVQEKYRRQGRVGKRHPAHAAANASKWKRAAKKKAKEKEEIRKQLGLPAVRTKYLPLDVKRYVSQRLASKKTQATVNREVSVFRRGFNLAREEERLSRVPYFPMLKEDNVRQGFFEKPEFDALIAGLPEVVAEVARFAYFSGWRRGEVVPLRWDAVDRAAKEVRLGTSKNGRPRSLPLDDALWSLIERRWRAREYKTREGVSAVSPLVFHQNGKPLRDFRKAWAKACKAAGVPGRLFHDLRRTAVRNLIRAGVPQSVAMSITGHETDSVFRRYDIVSQDDKLQALRRTQAHLAAVPEESNVRAFPNAEHGQKADNSGKNG